MRNTKDKREGTNTETQLRLRRGVPLEKLTVPQPVKKFPAFYGTRNFVTTKHISDYTNCIQDIYSLHLPYILESNPHPFYAFRGLKNQMRIRIACGLDSRSRAGFWKNDRAAVVLRSVIVKPQQWGGLGPLGAVAPRKRKMYKTYCDEEV